MKKQKFRISVSSLPLLSRKEVYSVSELIEILIDYYKAKREFIIIHDISDEPRFNELPVNIFKRDDVKQYFNTCEQVRLFELLNQINSSFLTSLFLSRTDIELEAQIKIALDREYITPLIKRIDVPADLAFELLKAVPTLLGFSTFIDREDSEISQLIELCMTSELYKVKINQIVLRKDFTPSLLLDFVSNTKSMDGLDVALSRFDFCKHLMTIDAEVAIVFAKKFESIELWKVVSRNKNLSLNHLIECIEEIAPLSFYSPEFWNMVISRKDCPLSYAIDKVIEIRHKSCTRELSKRKDFIKFIYEGDLNEAFNVVNRLDLKVSRDMFIERDDITLPIAYWCMEQNISSKDYIQNYVKNYKSKDELIDFAKTNRHLNFVQAVALRDDFDVVESIEFVRTYFRGNTWRILQNKKRIYKYFSNCRIKDIPTLIENSPGDSIEHMIFKYIKGSSYEILKQASKIDTDSIWNTIISRNDYISNSIYKNNVKNLARALKGTKHSGAVWFSILQRTDIDTTYLIELAKKTDSPGLCRALECKFKKQ